jgi:hypothetical protein
MKDALTTHFFECTQYMGNIPIKVLKKFMKKPEEKASGDDRSSSGSSRYLMVPKRIRTPSCSSDEHERRKHTTQASPSALVITQKVGFTCITGPVLSNFCNFSRPNSVQSSSSYHISLGGVYDTFSVQLSSEELLMFLDEMHRETPDYDILAELLEKDSMSRGRDIHGIFGGVSSIRVALAWEVKSPSHLQDKRERHRLRESLFR